MRGLLALVVLAWLAGTAAADKKIQVLQSDGRADAKVRARIDAGVLALAKSTGEQIVPGDITFTDAAAAVGCKPDDAACKDEVLGMLAVDEIVVSTVTPKPGGFEVAVRRIAKGGAAREAISFVAADRLDKLDSIAPLFASAARPRPTPPPAVGPRPITPPAVGPVIGPSPPGPSPVPAPVPVPAQPADAPPDPAITAAPRPSIEIGPSLDGPQPPPLSATQPSFAEPIDAPPPPPRRRLHMAGMAGGGALLLIGLIFWGSAASVQGEIDDAPANTKAQLRALQDLEDKGDAYAGVGNLFVVGGLVLGGVSTYYFVKGNRRRATTARIVPTVFDRGGGGLAISIGGLP